MREPVDLNAASKEELMQLQDVSERSAQMLVDYRARNGRFESLEDLAELESFSDRTVEQMREQVTVGPGRMADCHRRWLSRRPT
jgi:competence protein ComEA